MRAVWNGQVLAESGDTVVVEGNHYFPQESVRKEFFRPSSLTTFCGWKGTARYYSVAVDGKTNRDCAWCYEEPNEAASRIRGRIAFWNGVDVVP